MEATDEDGWSTSGAASFTADIKDTRGFPKTDRICAYQERATVALPVTDSV
ncbi:MAG TPA: hypothetical protein VIK05_06335 [Ilumatobacteraceae bacterium]